MACVDGHHWWLASFGRTHRLTPNSTLPRVVAPPLQTGSSYHRLDGNLQASDRADSRCESLELKAGFGAGAVGAGQTIGPGWLAEFHLADAMYETKIAERPGLASMLDTALNDQLLERAWHINNYAAQRRLALLEDHTSRIGTCATNASFAKAGEGLQADADRLATELNSAMLRPGWAKSRS